MIICTPDPIPVGSIVMAALHGETDPDVVSGVAPSLVIRKSTFEEYIAGVNREFPETDTSGWSPGASFFYEVSTD